MQTETTDMIYRFYAQNGQLYAGKHSGLYRFVDQEWQSLYAKLPLEEHPPTTAIAVSPNSESIFAGVNGGVLYSLDAGATWTAIQFPLPPSPVVDIVLSPNFEHDKTLIAGTLDDGIYRSEDGGQTWNPFNTGLFDRNINCLTIGSRGQLFAGTSTGLYRSANLGRLWQAIEIPDPTLVTSVFVGEDWVFCGSDEGEIWVKREGGEWSKLTQVPFEGEVISIRQEATRLLVLAENGVWFSHDMGASWQSIETGAEIATLALPDGLSADGTIWLGDHEGHIIQKNIP